MQLTNDEKQAILTAIHSAEAFASLIPAPGGLVFLAIAHAAEDELQRELDPETLESLRAGVYDRLQARITARFAAPKPSP